MKKVKHILTQEDFEGGVLDSVTVTENGISRKLAIGDEIECYEDD